MNASAVAETSAVSAAEARSVLAASEVVHTSEEVSRAYDRMATDIQSDLGELSPVIIAVLIGGMIPTAQLLARLEIPLELDYVHATRYRGGTSGHELEWRVRPSPGLKARHVLVVDDILDEGHTLKAIVDEIRAIGAATVSTAVLVEKQHHRRVSELDANFAGVKVPDRYVFGCGMDYKGWFRQLPAIHSVREE